MTRPGLSPVPASRTADAPWMQRAVAAINSLVTRANNTTELTLTNGGTTTAFVDSRLTYWCGLTFTPQTARAAGLLGGLYVAQATMENGQCTVTHANPGGTDATFRVTIHG